MGVGGHKNETLEELLLQAGTIQIDEEGATVLTRMLCLTDVGNTRR